MACIPGLQLYTIYTKLILQSNKKLSIKDLKLITELALTIKSGKLFQSFSNLLKK